MLVVLAGSDDTGARAFARSYGPGIGVLTPSDLSVRGWVDGRASGDTGTAVVEGARVPTREIQGVLVRLRAVTSSHVPHVVAEDRSYVATEMTAFLLGWLGSLRCPVLNRPSPPDLTSPCWPREQWVLAARRCGIPVVPARRSVRFVDRPRPAPPLDGADGHSVTVVGDQCVGATGATEAGQARLLARHAGAELLAVRFTPTSSGVCVLDATPLADLAHPDVAAAIADQWR